MCAKSRQRGASLIEVMVAIAMFGAAAMAVYPLMYQSQHLLKKADFNEICTNAVRAKMSEYKFGKYTNVSSVSTNLSVESAVQGSASTGFAYAKTRYNSERDNYCPHDVGTTTVRNVNTLPPATLSDLGREECIQGLGSGSPLSCTSAVDTNVRGNLPNFKLYVNLRRYNPTLPTSSSEDCAWYDVSTSYDFQHAEDMIKVTITGIIDLSAGGTFGDLSASVAGLSQSLVCQVADYLQPAHSIARFWLRNNGRIFRWKGTGATGTEEVFSSLASPNNIGLAVAPDNSVVYVLRAGGQLLLFTGCGGDGANLDCTGTTYYWNVPNNIVSITAKWLGSVPHTPNPTCDNPDRDDNQGWRPALFGLLSDHITPVCIRIASTDGDPDPAAAPDLTTYLDNSVIGTDTTRIPFVLSSSGRVHSVFMDIRGTKAYALDLTCPGYLGKTNCSAIYDSADINLQYPLEVFNVSAIAFSK